MAGGRNWLRKAGMLLALGAGSLAASAPPLPVSPSPRPWTADPDEQFILDVNIRQLRLADTVRAYNTPEGTCVVLGDFLTALDVPMRIDLDAKTASGWAFKESNRIDIDYAAHCGSPIARQKRSRSSAGTIRETPEGWCVQTAALAGWFGVGIKPMTVGIGADAAIRYEAAGRNGDGAAAARDSAFTRRRSISSRCPRFAFPTACGAPPALDFVVSGGLTYRANDGVRVDRQTSVYAAGEIAHLSYDAQVTTTSNGQAQPVAATRLPLRTPTRACSAR